MQGQDTIETVKLETTFVCSMVSGQIEKVLKEKKGYDVNIHIEKFTIKEKSEKTCIHLKGEATTEAKELKKICGNSKFVKNIVTMFLNSHWGIADNLLVGFLEKTLKQVIGCHVDLDVKDKKYIEKGGNSSVYVDAKAEIKTEKLEKVLKKYDLI